MTTKPTRKTGTEPYCTKCGALWAATCLCDEIGSPLVEELAANFTVEVVKVRGGTNWAIKATVDGRVRYRAFHYKKEALTNLEEWNNYHESPLRVSTFRGREFNHNFHTADQLGIWEEGL